MNRTSPPFLAASFLRQTVHYPERVRHSRLWNWRDEDAEWKRESSGVDYPEPDILAAKLRASGLPPRLYVVAARRAFATTHTWAIENRKAHKKVALRRYFLGSLRGIIADLRHERNLQT